MDTKTWDAMKIAGKTHINHHNTLSKWLDSRTTSELVYKKGNTI
jgi:hypothetical protein